MIAIQSNVELFFPLSFQGIITTKIDLIQNKPESAIYIIRLIDTCSKEVEEEYEDLDMNTQTTTMRTHTVIKQFGKPITRFKELTYEELDNLATVLQVDMSDRTQLRENINELFRQGLLLITQSECEAGQGNYGSEAQMWEILR